MNKKWRRLGAAALMVVSLGLVPLPASAAEECSGRTQIPLTVGVAGEPVATTPLLMVYLCRDDNTDNIDPTDLPRVYEEHHDQWTPTGTYEGTGIHLYIPWGASVSSVRLTYTVGDQGQNLVVPIGLGDDSGQTVCLFYTGDAEANPGGCQLFVES